jgi:predicted ATPase
MGVSLVHTGEIVNGAKHYDQALALFDYAEHRPLASRFGMDIGVVALDFRSWARWLLGYPGAALTDTNNALDDARASRAIGQTATLMHALLNGSLTQILCGNYAIANAETDELAAVADEKVALMWRALGMSTRGCVLFLSGKPSDAVHMLTSGITALRSTGATLWTPLHLSHLTRAYAELDQFDYAWRCIDEAMTVIETTKERWYEAEVHRTAGEIALMSPEPDAAKAETYFDRALAVARSQQAKSLELRAAISIARLWRDRGRRDEARELLAPVYGWFTEGFDTLDLKQAKTLLDELA